MGKGLYFFQGGDLLNRKRYVYLQDEALQQSRSHIFYDQ